MERTAMNGHTEKTERKISSIIPNIKPLQGDRPKNLPKPIITMIKQPELPTATQTLPNILGAIFGQVNYSEHPLMSNVLLPEHDEDGEEAMIAAAIQESLNELQRTELQRTELHVQQVSNHELEVLEARRIREEQDREYEESLALDRQKDLDRAIDLVSIEEVDLDYVPEDYTIRFRLPTASVTHTFNSEDPISKLITQIRLDADNWNVNLFMMDSTPIDCSNPNKSLRHCGLSNRMTIYVNC
jgi:hypothetical protein